MNCDKYSVLIYKKLDNDITEKELEKLNKHISKCENCKQELKLIETLKSDLRKEKEVELPADFSIRLREKLAEYNLNREVPHKKKIWLPVNTIATACVAVCLVVFAFGIKDINTRDVEQPASSNTADINTQFYSGTEKNILQDSIGNEDTKKSRTVTPDNDVTSDILVNNTSDTNNEALHNDKKKSEKAVISPETSAENSNVYTTSTSTPDLTEESIDNPASTVTDLTDDTDNSDNSSGGTSFSGSSAPSSAGGGGGGSSSGASGGGSSSMIKPLTVNINSEIDISTLIPYAEKINDSSYSVPMDKFEEAKNILKDYNISIENDTQNSKKLNNFIINIR